jgi:hypothetical protein
MTQRKKYWVLGVAMLVAGAVRMPFEQQLTADVKKEKLLSPKLEIARERNWVRRSMRFLLVACAR